MSDENTNNITNDQSADSTNETPETPPSKIDGLKKALEKERSLRKELEAKLKAQQAEYESKINDFSTQLKSFQAKTLKSEVLDEVISSEVNHTVDRKVVQDLLEDVQSLDKQVVLDKVKKIVDQIKKPKIQDNRRYHVNIPEPIQQTTLSNIPKTDAEWRTLLEKDQQAYFQARRLVRQSRK